MPPPPHWPQDVHYIDSSQFHASVSADIRSFIVGCSPASPKNKNSRSLVIIRPITSASHPAKGQYGLFALRKIPPNTRILDYTGEIHCDDRSNSDYDLSLYRSQDGTNVGVDANVMGNEARFINDYRGIRGKPNALFLDGRTTSGELRMSIWSSGEVIRKGEEILVSYGKSWWRARSLATDDSISRPVTAQI